MHDFVIYTGFILGGLIIFCTAAILSADFKIQLIFLINSFLGCSLLMALSAYISADKLNIVISPIIAVCIGILGIPGTVILGILSFI